MRKNLKPLIGAILSILGILIPITITSVPGTKVFGFGFGLILSVGLVNDFIYAFDITTFVYIFFMILSIEILLKSYIQVNKGEIESKIGGFRTIIGGLFVIIAPIIFTILNLRLFELGTLLFIGFFYPIIPGTIAIIGGIQMR